MIKWRQELDLLLYHGSGHILVVGPPKLTFQVNCPVPKLRTLGYLKGQLLAPQVIQYIHFR